MTSIKFSLEGAVKPESRVVFERARIKSLKLTNMEIHAYLFCLLYIIMVFLFLRIILSRKVPEDEDSMVASMEDNFAHLLRNPDYHARLQNAFTNLRVHPVQAMNEKRSEGEKDHMDTINWVCFIKLI